jgi:hypothetical protein
MGQEVDPPQLIAVPSMLGEPEALTILILGARIETAETISNN